MCGRPWLVTSSPLLSQDLNWEEEDTQPQQTHVERPVAPGVNLEIVKMSNIMEWVGIEGKLLTSKGE